MGTRDVWGDMANRGDLARCQGACGVILLPALLLFEPSVKGCREPGSARGRRGAEAVLGIVREHLCCERLDCSNSSSSTRGTCSCSSVEQVRARWKRLYETHLRCVRNQLRQQGTGSGFQSESDTCPQINLVIPNLGTCSCFV